VSGWFFISLSILARHTYYSLLGEYIFKATFDPSVNIVLEVFIAKVKKLPLTTAEGKEIATLLGTKGTFTLTIHRNKRKAGALEKKLKKNLNRNYHFTFEPPKNLS